MLRLFLTVQAVELLALVLVGLSSFVEKHIWSPAYSYYLLLVLVVLDVLTKNRVQGKPLQPRNLAGSGPARCCWPLPTALLSTRRAYFSRPNWCSRLSCCLHLKQLIVSLGKFDVIDNSVADLLTKRITTRAAKETLAPPPSLPPNLPLPDANLSTG